MLNKNFALMTLVVFAAGCGIEARTYVMDKPRVDVDLTTGNGGCVYGKCPPQTLSKQTRKTYVLELTRPVPESEVQKIEETAVNAIMEPVETPPGSNTAPDQGAPAASGPASSDQVVVPVVGDQTAAAPSAGSEQNGGNLQAQNYTVQKDDTLQKISKKVYGTYGKWYKIYEANKSKIKNPNVLQPGMVLAIPVIK